MSTEQQQPETQVLDLSGGLLALTAENGWVDVMAQLKVEASKLAPSTFILARSLRNEDAIASPESYDVKTDPMALPIVPLSELVKSKKIRKASDLSAAELIDTADILLCHFAAYCRGIAHSSTIDTCAYVHDLALTEGTPLSPFVSSVLKLMVFVAHIVESGGIRDGEEEFSQAFTATVLGYEAAKGQVLEYDELDAPAADAANPLVVRFAFLRDLAKFFQQVAETQRSGATQTHEAFASSLETLSTSIVALRAARKGDDVIKGPAGVFNEMGTRWNAMMTPQPAVDSQVWSESLDFYARVAEETAAGTQQLFAARNDLMEIYRRVKTFASREVPPLLLSRSCVAIFLFQHEKPFGGEHALVLLFNYLKEQCGAPWFLSFALLQTKEENDLVDACVKYAISVTGTQMPQRSTPAYDDVKRRILMGNTSIGVEVSRLMLGLCQAYLRNRGRCHRDLLNILANIAQVNNTAISLERSLFAMATPSVTQTHAAALMKCEVVSNLVSWLLFDTCHTICNLTQSLGLLTHAELLGVAWFYQAFEMCKAECEAVLYPLEVMDVKDRRAAVLPPIVLARTAVARNGPHAQSLMLRELKIGVAKANVISLASLLSRIPQCKMPDRSLQTVSNIFNHRFVQILEAARRPYIVAWDDIIRNVKMFTTDTTDKSTKLAVDQFKTAASRATALREAVVDPIDVAFLRAVEEAAKKNAVVVGVAAKMNREIEVNVHPLFPEVLSYALKAAAAAPAPKAAA